jgi:hypothetical protein
MKGLIQIFIEMLIFKTIEQIAWLLYLPLISMLHATLTKLLSASAAAFWCRGSGRFNQDTRGEP